MALGRWLRRAQDTPSGFGVGFTARDRPGYCLVWSFRFQ